MVSDRKAFLEGAIEVMMLQAVERHESARAAAARGGWGQAFYGYHFVGYAAVLSVMAERRLGVKDGSIAFGHSNAGVVVEFTTLDGYNVRAEFAWRGIDNAVTVSPPLEVKQ